MQNVHLFGWDIGGAHVKLAIRFGNEIQVFQWACPLWKGVEHLQHTLQQVHQQYHGVDAEHRVTMTGELVDLFADRRAGVRAILQTFEQCFDNRDRNYVFGRNGLQPMHDISLDLNDFASSNWLSTVRWVAAECTQGLLVDIGSTTTDVIAFYDGLPVVIGYDDHARLKSRELVYTGVVRTGVNNVVEALQYQQESVPVVAEYFANMADVYRILENLPAHADLLPSPDGAGKTRQDSLRRLARMICLDYQPADETAWVQSARSVADAQSLRIEQAIAAQLLRGHYEDPLLVGAGVGRFVVRQLAAKLAYQYVDFDQLLEQKGYRIRALGGDCAPAIALVA